MTRHLSFSILTSLACVTVLGASGCDNAPAEQTTPEDITTVPGPECPAPACPGVAQQGNTCTDWATMMVGKYQVFNNPWGVKQAGVTGQQCIWSLCDSGSAIGWGTSWDWTGGNTRQVVSYSAARLGAHCPPCSTVAPDPDLPLLLSANRAVTCTWSFALTLHKGVGHNVAYDLWLGSSAAPQNPSDEIMIWLSNIGQGPSGSAVSTPNLAGAHWTLFESVPGNPPWQVHTFIRNDAVNCATLNIMDFTNYLIQNQGLDSSKYLVGIEAGPETLNGQGELDTQYYSCNVAPAS